jgi:hypothetical protein
MLKTNLKINQNIKNVSKISFSHFSTANPKNKVTILNILEKFKNN